MGVSFRQAEEMVEAAAAELFDADPRVRSVGITQHDGGYGYRAVRNSDRWFQVCRSRTSMTTCGRATLSRAL
jgi:hypothetical protein